MGGSESPRPILGVRSGRDHLEARDGDESGLFEEDEGDIDGGGGGGGGGVGGIGESWGSGLGRALADGRR